MISVCLISGNAFLFFGLWLNIQLQLKAVKHEVKHHIKENVSKAELTHFSYAITENPNIVEWEHAMEFEFEGEMYDVVFSEIKNDTAHYWCWKDQKESHLNKKLTFLLQEYYQESPEEQEKQMKFGKWLTELFWNPSYTCSPTPIISKNKLNSHQPNLYSNLHEGGIFCPPEWLI